MRRPLVWFFLLRARVTGWRLALGWRRQAADDLRAHREELAGFEERLHARWGDALDGLELLRLRAVAIGSAYNDENRPRAAAEQDYRFDALAKLHARACRVASEVQALLRTGHAEGAHARWRTLHELAVTMMFLDNRGRDVAEMYLLHGEVREHAVAERYQQHAERLGERPFSEAEMAEMRAVRDDLTARFGADYAKEYGWANIALNRRRSTFANVEAAVTMDHWRPWYRLASEGQHAGSQALRFALPLLSPRLLAGPSNAGLAEPGSATAISLVQVSATFVSSWTDLDSVSSGTRSLQQTYALLALSRRVQRDFAAASAQLDREHAAEEAESL